MKIGIGSDHAGFNYKELIRRKLEKEGHEVHDFGTFSDESVDYPLFIFPVAKAVSCGEFERGIVLGGSGNGEAMAANRVPGVRCALCWNVESARLARQHNDANMLSLGERLITERDALDIVEIWLNTAFDGGRHARRIRQLDPNAKNDEHVAGKKPPDDESDGQQASEDAYDVVISFRYMIYSEGKKCLEFTLEPGLKHPTRVLIPSKDRWASEFPAWAKDRREKILERLKSKSVHLKPDWKEF